MSEEDEKSVEKSPEKQDQKLENQPDGKEDHEDDEDLAAALDSEDVDEEASIENMDKALSEEDPLFQDELSKINTDDFANLVIGDEQASEEVDEEAKGPGFWRSFFNNLPQHQKMKLYSAIAVIVVCVPLIALLLKGKILPRFEIPYTVSMRELTEDIYVYPTDGVEVPLFDDFRSNAVTYAIPKTMINLKREGDNPSYGEFEFFLNIREKEMVGIVKGKETEIMDLIQRTLEQITWSELQTPVGKEKVKKVVRHRVNDYLQGNVILGVYYRSIILQK